MTGDEKTAVTQAQIQQWMQDYIKSVIDVADDPFPVDAQFDTIGMDSVEMTIMAGMIEERYGIQVEPDEIMTNPSVKAFSDYLAGRLNAG